ncbi:hypothetical protein [Leminorella richardii]|nr:hypothetical protein [Leminorella richardii]
MDLKTKGYCCDRCGNYIAHDMAATEEEQERETGRTKIKYQAMIARKTEYHWQGTNYSGTRFLCLSCTRAFLSFMRDTSPLSSPPSPAPKTKVRRQKAKTSHTADF